MKTGGITKLPDEIEECEKCGERICPSTRKCPFCHYPNITAHEHPWAYKLPNDEPVKDLFDDDKED